MQLKEKIEKLVQELGRGLHEREEIVAVALLGALSGQNTFLYGPPGTAKSLISRRIACAFKDARYFECLMNRFSTPDEVFGPVSIKALKQDKYTRKTDGYLPSADFAFLDEIWKSSTAVLNTLLTLTNERIFRNGEEIKKAPLKALVAASNETPAEGQGLEALYDRFIIRMMVPPMQNREKFETLLQSNSVQAEITIPDALKISSKNWEDNLRGLHEVSLSQETLTIISLIWIALAEKSEEMNVYVSDRRWKKAALLMKAAAMFCGRKETNHSDALLLRHCLWTTEDNRQAVINIVENAVRECGYVTSVNLVEIDEEKERLDQEINNELFYSRDVYKTTKMNGRDYFKVQRTATGRHYGHSDKKLQFYIEFSKMKSTDEFNPVDSNGNEIADLTCCFDKQGSCSVDYDRYYQVKEFVPKIQFHKGDKKEDVNERLISSLHDAANDLKKSISEALNQVKDKKATHESALHTPFLSKEIQAISVDGIQKQIEDLNLRFADCERLISLCK
ncbi:MULTISPECIES: AAA family ATPase [unclassified Endozoicomonas]|uniref:AAA family ATPase n=1 Tax=unclassified Endozoicomonas TaxID=2644528 RepID=UPI003BB71CF3